MGLFTKVFGTYSQRELKSIYPIVDKITALEEDYKKLTDAQLQAKTPEFKERLANGETLDDILPEAFATVREAADRVLGMRPYPVQLVGGIVLHQGRIAEMKTGEGKTLVATLPAYLNALTGEGVHIVTVNDYLAKRDSEWMGKVHRFLGLTVGLIIHDMKKEERQKAYAADITYGTNNEMGFDYLRDNMALYASEQVQRGHAFAIVDEVDSILIDEARTPLIISGMGEKSTLLRDVLRRIAGALDVDEEGYQMLLSRSMLVSADNAHAIHPNHPELSDKDNAPRLNGGIVLKFSAPRRYATDGGSAAAFRALCRRADVPVQTMANRSDLPGGSTLGSIAGTLVPVSAVDIGLAQLAMHAAVEVMGAEDYPRLIAAMRQFYKE